MFSYFWQRVFQASLFFLFLMSLFRFILFVRVPVPFQNQVEYSQILQAFLLGLRFDILVWSFLLSPLLPLTYFGVLRKWQFFPPSFIKIYWFLIWFLFCLVEMFGGSHYLNQKRFLRLGSYGAIMEYPWLAESQKILFQNINNQVWVFLCLVVFLLGIGFIRGSVLFKASPGQNYREVAESPLRLLLPLLVVGLGARGTLTPHHLELRHSEEISNNKILNELSLNALWSLDKEKE